MPTAWDIRLNCLPEQAPTVTTMRVELGWAPTAVESCVVVTGLNEQGQLVSETVTRSYPDECVALPEPAGALISGLMFLAWPRRSRRGGRRRRLT